MKALRCNHLAPVYRLLRDVATSAFSRGLEFEVRYFSDWEGKNDDTDEDRCEGEH